MFAHSPQRLILQQTHQISFIKQTNTIFSRYLSKRTLTVRRSIVSNCVNSRKKLRTRLYISQERSIFVPPVWLRPLLRPLAIAAVSFLGGVIMQLYKGQPPVWYLEAQDAPAFVKMVYLKYIVYSSIICFVLYWNKLKLPFVDVFLGQTEYNLQLADDYACSPLNAYWDSRSANDSMTMRLEAMEKALGIAISSENADLKRAQKIRSKGYTNAVCVALKRANYYAEVGELVHFEAMIESIEEYVAKGGEFDYQKIFDVKKVAYNARAHSYMCEAKNYANIGNVAKCVNAINGIREIRNKFEDIEVQESDLELTIDNAKNFYLTNLIDEARKERKKGSRVKAKNILDQARVYAVT